MRSRAPSASSVAMSPTRHACTRAPAAARRRPGARSRAGASTAGRSGGGAASPISPSLSLPLAAPLPARSGVEGRASRCAAPPRVPRPSLALLRRRPLPPPPPPLCAAAAVAVPPPEGPDSATALLAAAAAAAAAGARPLSAQAATAQADDVGQRAARIDGRRAAAGQGGRRRGVAAPPGRGATRPAGPRQRAGGRAAHLLVQLHHAAGQSSWGMGGAWGGAARWFQAHGARGRHGHRPPVAVAPPPPPAGGRFFFFCTRPNPRGTPPPPLRDNVPPHPTASDLPRRARAHTPGRVGRVGHDAVYLLRAPGPAAANEVLVGNEIEHAHRAGLPPSWPLLLWAVLVTSPAGAAGQRQGPCSSPSHAAVPPAV